MKYQFYALKLCAVCIVVFVLQLVINGFTELFVLTQNIGEVWRFISAIFLHGNLIHLLYNLFALALFGSIAEKIIGGRKFLIVFFSSGIIANLVAVNFYPSSLGASGAIFGIIGALVILKPGMAIWVYGLPMPMAVAGIIWAIGDLIGAYGYLSGNPLSNTGNIAHLSGLALGLLLGLFYRDWGSKAERKEKIVISEQAIRDWEDHYLKS